jgi:Tfp pilus assembly protein PilN
MAQALKSVPLDLNILPERYQPRRVGVFVVAAVIVASILLLGLALVYNAGSQARARTADLEARLDQLRATLSQTQLDQAQLTERLNQVGEQIEQTSAQTALLRAEFSTLSQQRVPRSAGIVAAVAALVPRVYILTIAQEGNIFTLTGQAGSQGLVLDYARALQAGGQFGNVRILSMVNADPLGLAPDVEFSIQVEQ